MEFLLGHQLKDLCPIVWSNRWVCLKMRSRNFEITKVTFC